MFWPLLLVLGGLCCLAADDNPCTLHRDGKYYDITPLKASKDYEFQTPGDHKFAINVCRGPAQDTFGLKDVDSAEIGGFVRRDHGDFSIGALNTTLSIEDLRPRITMTNGSRCKSKSGENAIRASTVIEFVCDPSLFGSGKPRLVAQLPPGDDDDACAFFIEWKTSIACPTKEPGGTSTFLGFLMVTMLAVALLYLVAGTLYNRYILRLRGLEQIPRFSIESMKYHANEAFDWIKDLTDGIRSSDYNRTSTSGYRPPFPGFSSNSGGINPVSHQSQVQSAASESGDIFVRPQPRPPAGSATGKRVDINPISHQAQTSSQSLPPLPPSSSPPPPPPAKDSKPRLAVMDSNSAAPEREFTLGDEDDDGSELVQIEQPLVPRQGAPDTEAENTGGVSAAPIRRGISADGVVHS